MNRLPRLLVVATLLAFAACSKSGGPAESQFLKQHIGEQCVVEFRRDALGSAAPLPVSPKTDSINGADVVQVGKLAAVEGRGLILEETGAQPVKFWIPYPVILSVKFTGVKAQ
jgi:hypothetical protein